jgi:uncharacterized protein (TIGR02284 family)
MEDRATILKVLNNLVEVSRDGEAGFRTCAADSADPALKAYFEECAQRCDRAANLLADEVARRGGDPARTGSVGGAVHRAFLNIKSAIATKNDVAVLDECERGEDYALRAYATALDVDMPADLRIVVEAQYMGVKHNHDRIKALRDERKRMSA